MYIHNKILSYKLKYWGKVDVKSSKGINRDWKSNSKILCLYFRQKTNSISIINKHKGILYLSHTTEINFIIGSSISLHINRQYALACIEENNCSTNESANLQTSRVLLAKSRAKWGLYKCSGRKVRTETTLTYPFAFSFLLFHSLLLSS